jgi:hypothetical protein
MESARMPEAISLSGAGVRIPGAVLNRYGPVRGLVFPVSLGEHLPVYSDTAIAYHLVGGAPVYSQPPRGAAGLLVSESQGVFTLDASVFPNLIDAGTAIEMVSGPERDRLLRELVARVLTRWGRQVDLRAYDNDGADGIPSTRDDDGVLDLVVLALETERADFALRLPVNRRFRTQRGRVQVGEVLVVATPRYLEDAGARARDLAALVLHQMGVVVSVDGAADGRLLGEMQRARLGWTPTRWIAQSGDHEVVEGQILVAPAVESADYGSVWLVERRGNAAHVTRAVRERDGGLRPTFTHSIPMSERGGIVPLTRGMGVNGPRARFSWSAGGRALSVALSLSARAAMEDDARLRSDPMTAHY